MVTITSPVIRRRYTVERQIGKGGMGEVYRAIDRLYNQTVALKRVPFQADNPLNATDSDMRLTLAREFRTLASLRHPNIISVLDYGFDHDRSPYLTMEYLDNALNIVQAAQHQSFEERINLLLQMLEALNYLHWRGIIHRDVKPDNVLVTGHHVKVLDFGLATAQKQITGDNNDTISGTISYMPPEVLMGKSPSEKSDLYAVGMIAFEMIAGKHPFDSAKLPSEIISAILYQSPDLSPLDEFPPLKPIIERLINKEADERYPNVTEAIHAIDRAMGKPPRIESQAIRESFLQSASFVGREDETQTLSEALDSALEGNGGMWLVGGESGVGKSRLLNELRIRALVKNFHVLTGQGVNSSGLAYHIWREPLRQLLIATDLTDEEASRLKPIIPDISEIIGRDVPDIHQEQDARQRNQQLLIDVIVKIFQRQTIPIALFLEDLQWSVESLDVLRELIPRLDHMPLVIIGSYRHEERPSLPEELPNTHVMLLNRLSREHIVELSRSMLAVDHLQPALIDLLHRETEGNIFFLIEVLRSLAETAGQLTNIGTMTLPQRVVAGGIQQIIQRRLERVPEEARYLLQVAALYGRQLDLKVIQSIETQTSIPDWLLMCSNAAILEADGNQWRFTHDKLREGLLSQVDHLKPLHHLIGKIVEKLYANVPEQFTRLAYHWREAGDAERERYYSMKAGQLALKTFAFQDAIDYLGRALELTHDQTPLDQFAQTHHDLAHAYQSVSLYTPASEHYHASADLYRQVGNTHDLMLALADAGFVMGYGMGQHDKARAILDEALEIAEELNNMHIKGRVHRGLASISFTTGKYEDALRQAHAYQSICEQLNNQRELSASYNLIGVVSEFLGHYPQSLAAYQQSLESTVEPGIKSRVLRGIGEVLIRLGRIGEAEPHLNEAIEIARSIGEGHSLSLSLSSMALILIQRQQFDEAWRLGQESVQVSAKIGHPLVMINALNRLGDVAVEAGDLNEGFNQYREALKIAHEKGTIALVSHSFSGIATILYLSDTFDRSAELLGVILNDQHCDAWAKYRADHLFNQLRDHLSEDYLHRTVEQGGKLTLQAVITKYLEE
jgi:serine/threonine protein kinase/tetratricopeptide (TPR) repeat protein